MISVGVFLACPAVRDCISHSLEMIFEKSFHSPLEFLHVLPLHLTNQILPPALSANHVSAAKLKAALLSSVSHHFRHPCDPPSPHPPPDLHPEARFESPKSTPLSSHLQGLSSSITTTSHQCLDSIRGFSIPRTALPLPPKSLSFSFALMAINLHVHKKN